jgi:hypothetical protein
MEKNFLGKWNGGCREAKTEDRARPCEAVHGPSALVRPPSNIFSIDWEDGVRSQQHAKEICIRSLIGRWCCHQKEQRSDADASKGLKTLMGITK